MSCPNSPAADGFHRYLLARQGDQAPPSYETHCVYCGHEKQVRPPAPQTRWADSLRRGTLAGTAAKRAKREETP